MLCILIFILTYFYINVICELIIYNYLILNNTLNNKIIFTYAILLLRRAIKIK
jgi:hypothetical protein